jgi:hypothetical protein
MQRRILLMSAFASKLLVLTSAVLLALPPGWCCATPSQKPAQTPAKHAAHSCCRQPKQTPTPDQEPGPGQPVQKCCCENDLASPANPEKASPDLTFSVPVPSPDTLMAEVGGAGAASAISPTASPPLYILQCVWRC